MGKPLLRIVGLLCVFLFFSLLEIASSAAVEEKVMTFNIPVLPLSRALNEFAGETGLQVVVDARRVRGLKSSQVIGVVEVRAALFRLLAGTGLSLRVLAPGTIGLVAISRSVATDDFSPARSPYASYYAAVQQTILRAICRVPATSSDSDRLALMLWIDSAGAIGRLKFLDRTMDARRGEALRAAILEDGVGETPPAGVQQPITLIVSQQRLTSRGCRSGVIHHALN